MTNKKKELSGGFWVGEHFRLFSGFFRFFSGKIVFQPTFVSAFVFSVKQRLRINSQILAQISAFSGFTGVLSNDFVKCREMLLGFGKKKKIKN